MLFIYLFTYLFIYLFFLFYYFFLFIHSFIHSFIHLFIYLFIYLSIYQIGNQQYNSYTGYSPTPHGDMARHGEFKENRDVMSPYNKIPPIPKSSENPRTHFEMNLDDAAWHESESDTEGYAAQFKRSKLKAKEKPWYTVYKIDDYRRMQKEVRLGTLGPDLDNATYRERVIRIIIINIIIIIIINIIIIIITIIIIINIIILNIIIYNNN